MRRILTCVVCALLAITNVVTLFSSCKEPEPLPDPIIYTPESPYILENYQPSDARCHIGYDSGNINKSLVDTITEYSDGYCIVKGKKISSKSYYWKGNGLGFYTDKDPETRKPDRYVIYNEERFFGGYTETTVEITEVLSASGMEISLGDTVKVFEDYAVDTDGVFEYAIPVYRFSSQVNRFSLPGKPELLKIDTEYIFILDKSCFMTDAIVNNIHIDILFHTFVPFRLTSSGAIVDLDAPFGMGEIPPERLRGMYFTFRAYELSDEAQSRAEKYLQSYSNYFDKSSNDDLNVKDSSKTSKVLLYYRYLYEANEMYRKNDQ